MATDEALDVELVYAAGPHRVLRVALRLPGELRGTAFGVFNLVTGVAALVASLAAGMLWDAGGPAYTFLAGGAVAVVALLASAGVAAGQHHHGGG